MKQVFFALALSLTLGSITQAASTSQVLLEESVMVGFAPPEYQGLFRFQVLRNGVVQTIDNKNNVAVLAKIAKSEVQKIAAAVESIQETELKNSENLPPCMDAPTQDIAVVQSSGKKILVFRQAGCRDFTSDNAVVNNLGRTTKQLSPAFSSIRYLKQ